MSHTHNLKLLLVDSYGNIIEDETHLYEIKYIFTDPITHRMDLDLNVTIQWNLKSLDRIQKHVMGDLFSCPIYEKDSIIYKHTQKTIDSINSKYRILFYISRLVGDRHTIPDFIGFV